MSDFLGFLCIQGYPRRICSGCTSACSERVYGEAAPVGEAADLDRERAVLDALGLELDGGSSEPSASDPDVWHTYNLYRLRALEAAHFGSFVHEVN